MALERAVITLLSDDNIGIVETLSHIINQHEGNWLDSRMSKLSGKFAGILNISIDSSQIASLASALTQLKTRGIQVNFERENLSQAIKYTTREVSFELAGADRPGIVHEISQALAEQKISIVDIATECTSMAWSGDLMFSAKGKIAVPDTVLNAELLETIDAVADHLGLDIFLSAKL